MNIQLKSWEVRNLNIETIKENRNSHQKFQFSCGNGLSKANDKEFFIGFKVLLTNSKYDLRLEMYFSFETDETLTEEFKNSPFLKINAPAIAFPYLRSYISMLTMQSGLGTVVLPSVNFVKIAENQP